METMNFGDLNNENNNENSSQTPRRGGAWNKKLILSGAVLAILILSVIGWQYWQYTHSPYYQQLQAVKTIEKQQRESDKWGGKTPQETVTLFRDAIKKGDFDLASKYGRSKDIKPALEKINNSGNINLLIKDLEKGILEVSPGFSGEYVDLIIKENDQKKYSVLTMYKSDGGTWKIVEF